MTFAKWVFRGAGIYGLIVMLPQYFLEKQIGIDNPPPITHPENFYGFIGTVVAWQLVFLVISTDPKRYRPLMLTAVAEKIAFGAPAIILFAQGRLAATILAFGLIDLALGTLFVLSYLRTD
jgi:hypothetical protein